MKPVTKSLKVPESPPIELSIPFGIVSVYILRFQENIAAALSPLATDYAQNFPKCVKRSSARRTNNFPLPEQTKQSTFVRPVIKVEKKEASFKWRG